MFSKSTTHPGELQLTAIPLPLCIYTTSDATETILPVEFSKDSVPCWNAVEWGITTSHIQIGTVIVFLYI